jgi:hypothetical protein
MEYIFKESIINDLYRSSGLLQEQYQDFFKKGLESIETTYRNFVKYTKNKIRNEIVDAFTIFELNLEGCKQLEKSYKEKIAYKEGWDAFQKEYKNLLGNVEAVIDFYIDKAFINKNKETP